jgi:CheY-like chemotaxis protein
MAGKKILVVDDEQELLGLIEKKLISDGYQVTVAATAGEAINIAKAIIPDLILMDIILPDMEGSQAVQVLSEDPLTRHVPVVFLSGIISREEDAGRVRVGQRLYQALSKPFSSEELSFEIERAIRSVEAA